MPVIMAFGSPCVTALVRRRHALMPPGVTSFTPKAALERVQCVVDGLGQLLADAGHLGELVHPGFFTSCKPPGI